MIYGSIDTLTGGYRYDKRLVAHLRECGHQIEMLALPVARYPLRMIDNMAGTLLHRVAKAGYDILLQDELCHPSLFLLNRRLRRRSSIPIVSVVHHTLCSEPRSKALNIFLALPEQRYLDSVDGFVFNSRTTKAMTFQLSPTRRPFVVAPPCSDGFRGRISLAGITARTLAAGPLRLLFVGQVIERKGLLPLIEALSGVPRNHWRLEVVGNTALSPRYFRRVRQAIDAHGLAAHVRLLGSLDTEALARKFAESHLLCMPFAYEGFGMVTLEAFHFGLPMLGSAAGATPELVRDGDNGFLFDRNDLPAVSKAVRALDTDRARLLRLSVAAFESAGNHPSWQTSMRRIEKFLVNFNTSMRER
jgi:glycosyltransferase involved in cell wall biosynthesis